MPFKIVRNDITKMRVDAIVNTANPEARVGSGVDETIYKAAGWDKLLEARRKIGPIERGSAAITEGFDLSARYIIHTVGAKWDEEDPERAKKILRDCYDNSMSLAMEHGLKSIAFPLISTGNYDFPKEVGLKIAYDTISRYLYVSEMDVYLVVYDDEAFALSKKLRSDIDEYIDSHYVREEQTFGYSMEMARYRSAPAMPSGNMPSKAMPPGNMPSDARKTKAEKHSILKNIFAGGSRLDHKAEEKTADDEPDILVGSAIQEPVEYSLNEAFTEYKSLDELLKVKGETFQDRLFRYMDKSGKSDVEIYKTANISKQTFSKIKQPGHIPKKKTILSIALALKLSVDDTRDLLEAAGQAFSPSDKLDLIVQYCMYKGIYDLIDVECILFDRIGETLVS